MDKERSPFQIIILGVFAFFIVAAVFVFANLSGGGDDSIGEVVMWGTFEQATMDGYLRNLNEQDKRAGQVRYVAKPEDSYHEELVEALANGTGPDLFVLDQAHLLRHWSKIAPIPLETMSRRAFRDTFIDEGEMFVSNSGIRGLPLSVDPLVLYWNRDIFAQHGFANPPAHWDEIFGMAERITTRDAANSIEQSTIAFGEYGNVSHAKDIIATLIMQAGGDIIQRQDDGSLAVALSPDNFQAQVAPAQSALRFYTEFADPVKSVYSWNRSLPESRDAFAQGTLAMYVGYASEVSDIQAQNPNLNFDVAPLPQIRAGENTRTLTFGHMYTLAIPRAAANPGGAQQIALFLTDTVASELFAQRTGIPSPRRDVLSQEPTDPLAQIFRNAALLSRGWFDPAPEETDRIFQRMVGDVTSGALRLSDTVSRAGEELAALIREQ